MSRSPRPTPPADDPWQPQPTARQAPGEESPLPGPPQPRERTPARRAEASRPAAAPPAVGLGEPRALQEPTATDAPQPVTPARDPTERARRPGPESARTPVAPLGSPTALGPRLSSRALRHGPPAWLRDLAGAWIFYSVLPAWPQIPPRFERIARFAPWIGVLLGSLQALLWWVLEDRVPQLTQVALVLACALLLSGGLHMDGAMDTADGLAAGERALEAMKDSRVGASGAQALALLLLLRAAALAALGGQAPGCLVWAGFWGRIAPLLAMARFPYLRADGSAAFHRRHWSGLAAELRPSLALLGPLLLLSWRLHWPAAVLLGAVPTVVVPIWLGRRLGGHSGDSYGACVEWSEALALLLMAAALPVAAALRWAVAAPASGGAG